MLDLQHLPGNLNNQRQQVFIGQSSTLLGQWQTWVKPKGINWVHIYLVGKGGNGGNGAIGANSTAAGGGGGGSGAVTALLIPSWSISDTLFLSLIGQSTTTTLASVVSIYPLGSAPYVVAYVNGGANGGNAAGATAGSAGAGGATISATSMSYGWGVSAGGVLTLAGTAGIIGGVAVSGGPLLPPTTGSRFTGGTGGGGLPAAAATGTTGGGFSASSYLPAISAPVGQATATLPPNAPNMGFIFEPAVAGVLGKMSYGGMGSGSTHGTATGGGLVQMKGGDGAPGCGGGGSGGALTGSTAGTGGDGGPAFCIITCW